MGVAQWDWFLTVDGTVAQGSQASWKVLDFFLENSRTWKVLEKYP